MLEAVTTDQLRTFIAAAEQGSSSAAGRSLLWTGAALGRRLASQHIESVWFPG
jgi:DNA-binding transcriptional LysR family regulator